jgi:hypothetical protein
MRTVIGALLAISLGTVAVSRSASADPQRSPSCRDAAHRSFDFFLGDWDTYDVTNPRVVVARNHVTLMVGGCALREVYDQTDGLRGESFSTYDASRGVWHQSWVTNRGSLLLLEGAVAGDSLVFTAPERHPDGSTTLLRGVWWRAGSSVRERADRSKDNGRTWSPVFDIVFTPHKTGH